MPAFDPYTHVIKPMLAESRQTPFDSKDHIFELKWDGTRALAVVRDGLRFQNRRLSYVESRYPDLAVHTRKPAILDGEDRKSTRLNSSHSQISYADFCLKIECEPPASQPRKTADGRAGGRADREVMVSWRTVRPVTTASPPRPSPPCPPARTTAIRVPVARATARRARRGASRARSRGSRRRR